MKSRTALIQLCLKYKFAFYFHRANLIRDKMMLFDFMNAQNVDNWREMSDTVRTVGKSKAVLTLQTSQLFQRAVFFTLLNPQQNGASFAGVRTPTNLDLSRFKNIEITCRGQGQNSNYKISLRHRGQDSNVDLSYEQFFTVKFQCSLFARFLPNNYIYLRFRIIVDLFRYREISISEVCVNES